MNNKPIILDTRNVTRDSFVRLLNRSDRVISSALVFKNGSTSFTMQGGVMYSVSEQQYNEPRYKFYRKYKLNMDVQGDWFILTVKES